MGGEEEKSSASPQPRLRQLLFGGEEEDVCAEKAPTRRYMYCGESANRAEKRSMNTESSGPNSLTSAWSFSGAERESRTARSGTEEQSTSGYGAWRSEESSAVDMFEPRQNAGETITASESDSKTLTDSSGWSAPDSDTPPWSGTLGGFGWDSFTAGSRCGADRVAGRRTPRSKLGAAGGGGAGPRCDPPRSGQERGAGEGPDPASSEGEEDSCVAALTAQMAAAHLRWPRGAGEGHREPCPRVLPPPGSQIKRQDSGVFRTPMACVKSPERDPNLPSVVVDGDAELPLMHSVSFYRRQRPQEVRMTPVKPVVRNREVGRHPSDERASTSQQQSVNVQERVKQLQHEATQQLNVMSQASRALNLCNSTIEFTGSAEMVEAERLLLVATHRRQAALSEIQRLKTEGAMRQQGITQSASRGSLSISSVTLPLKTSFVREVASGSANYVYYFVVLLRYRGQVIATQMLSSEDSIKGNAINFPNLVNFRELEADFGVTLEVYGLQAQREMLPHDAKYHIRKDRSKTPKKLLKQQSQLTSPAVQSPAGPHAVRATSFQLMGFVHVTARNLANNSWVLEKVPSSTPLDGGVLMTVTCDADCAVEERGFVTVFDDVSGLGAWHRRWCRLAAGRLAFWKYPEDEQRQPPSSETDLRRCVTERVGPVPRDICARQNTVLLVTVREARPDDQDSLVMQRRGSLTRIRHLLSLDTREERQLWSDQLNETLANIRAWDPDALHPHLDPSA